MFKPGDLVKPADHMLSSVKEEYRTNTLLEVVLLSGKNDRFAHVFCHYSAELMWHQRAGLVFYSTDLQNI